MCHSVWAVSRQKLASQLSETKLRKVDRTVVARGVTFQAVVRQKRSLFKCQCIYTKVLTEGTVFNVSYVEMGPSFLRAQRYPRHRMSSRLSGKGLIRADIACVAGAWKQWAKERTGAREGDTRGVSPSRAPVFFLCPLLPSAFHAGQSGHEPRESIWQGRCPCHSALVTQSFP